MSSFEWLKMLHASCALVSIAGFALRGYWVLGAHPLRSHRLTRVSPHLIDTLLLATALGMLWLWRMVPWGTPWLVAKLVALLVYIGCGIALMRFARTPAQQGLAYGAALLTAGYIISVAMTHDALGVFAVLGR